MLFISSKKFNLLRASAIIMSITIVTGFLVSCCWEYTPNRPQFYLKLLLIPRLFMLFSLISGGAKSKPMILFRLYL